MPSTRTPLPVELSALAVPDRCGGCGTALRPGRATSEPRAWCTHCMDRCGPVPGAWSPVGGACPGWAAAFYAGRVRRAVLAAKRGAPTAATELLLARWPGLAETNSSGSAGNAVAPADAADAVDRITPVDVVVSWIPAHPRRAIAGPDAGRALARAVAAEIDAPAERLLWRTPWSRRQAGRDDAARRADPQRLGLRAVGRAPECVLLVDDVRTTGTTLDHAATLLRAAGAAHVTAVTVAIAPPRPGA